MWKLLIADDEPKIRKGIRSIVESSVADVMVVADAEDGETALGLARETRPDIFLLDINMPFMSGIELIEQLEKERLDAKVIIISGYDEFEYAQKALKLKVFDYLLKPIMHDALVQTIQKAISELETSRRNQQYLNWAKQQLEHNIPQLRELFLNDLVHGRLTVYEANAQADFLSIQIHESNGLILVKIEEQPSLLDTESEMDRYLVLFAARNIIEEILNPLQPAQIFKDAQSNIVCLTSMASRPDLPDLCLKIKSAIEQYLKRSVLVSSASCGSTPDQLSDTYKNLLENLKANASVSPIVRRIKLFIECHYNQSDLSLQAVAQEVNISPAYLSRLLKEEEGYSFIEYLTMVRIKMAIQFMNDPGSKIVDIAEKVGYSTQHYFSTAFRKILGVSPSQYRKGMIDGE